VPFTQSRRLSTVSVAIGAIAVLGIAVHVGRAQGSAQVLPPPTLGLQNGTLDFDTPDFTLKLVKDSQTIAALQPKGAKGLDANTPFDFTPADQLMARQSDGFNHLGDITLRVKQAGWHNDAWVDLSSSAVRKPVTALAVADARAPDGALSPGTPSRRSSLSPGTPSRRASRLTNAGGWVTVKLLDSFRRRIYIAPLGLYLTLDAGTFDSVAIQPTTKAVRITLSPATTFTRHARLRIEQPAHIAGVGTYSMASGTFTTERGAVVVPLKATATVIEVGQ
jgi:hypothetical protein